MHLLAPPKARQPVSTDPPSLLSPATSLTGRPALPWGLRRGHSASVTLSHRSPWASSTRMLMPWAPAAATPSCMHAGQQDSGWRTGVGALRQRAGHGGRGRAASGHDTHMHMGSAASPTAALAHMRTLLLTTSSSFRASTAPLTTDRPSQCGASSTTTTLPLPHTLLPPAAAAAAQQHQATTPHRSSLECARPRHVVLQVRKGRGRQRRPVHPQLELLGRHLHRRALQGHARAVAAVARQGPAPAAPHASEGPAR